MHVASGWLQQGRATVGEAAARLGYESEPAFSRAFKRVVGIPPGAVRRSGRDAGDARVAAAVEPRRRRSIAAVPAAPASATTGRSGAA